MQHDNELSSVNTAHCTVLNICFSEDYTIHFSICYNSRVWIPVEGFIFSTIKVRDIQVYLQFFPYLQSGNMKWNTDRSSETIQRISLNIWICFKRYRVHDDMERSSRQQITGRRSFWLLGGSALHTEDNTTTAEL